MGKSSLQEKLAKRRQDIKDRSAGGTVNFIKEGTMRIRIKPTPENKDWSVETTHFYLGGDIKGVYSRKTIGEPCPLDEKYEELKDSKHSGDSEIAKSMKPRTKYLVAAVVFVDERGKEVDEKKSEKLTQIPTGVYTQMIDFFLDPDLGDFTDPEDGYDFKIKRTGKGLQDTEYTLLPVPKSPRIPKGYEAEVDPEVIFIEEVLLSYEDCEDKLAQFLVSKDESADEDDEPRKKKKRRRKKD